MKQKDREKSYLGDRINIASGNFIAAQDITQKGDYVVYGANGSRGFTDKYNCEEQKIIVGRVGTCGIVHKTPAQLKTWVTDNAFIITPKPGVGFEYLYHLLSSVDFTPYIGGSTQPVISQKSIKSIVVSVPPLKEQNRIAHILSTVDATIEAYEEELTELNSIKRTLLHDLLQPPINAADKYQFVKLGDMATLNSGYAFKQQEWSKNGVPVVKIANLQSEQLNMDKCQCVDLKMLTSLDDKYVLKNQDVVIAMSGATVGKVSKVYTSKALLLNQRVGVFRTKDNQLLDQEFLFYSICNSTFEQKVQRAASGAAQPNISLQQLMNFTIYCPEIKQQKRIAHILNIVDKSIIHLEAKLRDASKLKQSLLGNLLTT